MATGSAKGKSICQTLMSYYTFALFNMSCQVPLHPNYDAEALNGYFESRSWCCSLVYSSHSLNCTWEVVTDLILWAIHLVHSAYQWLSNQHRTLAMWETLWFQVTAPLITPKLSYLFFKGELNNHHSRPVRTGHNFLCDTLQKTPWYLSLSLVWPFTGNSVSCVSIVLVSSNGSLIEADLFKKYARSSQLIQLGWGTLVAVFSLSWSLKFSDIYLHLCHMFSG